jgi:tripartite-type tricarboxylate transporter receptor subunit TctC
MKATRRRVMMIAGTFILFMFPALVLGAYPEREITVYCGSSAGGTTDMGIRLLSDMVSKSFGQPIVVVNKPGASHTLCANFVANSKPDGYTLGGLSSGALWQVPNLRKVPYDSRKDFTYIATYTDYTSGLVVKSDAPWKTMKEFMDYSKNNPGAMIYGSDGHGMATHILMEYLGWKWGGVNWKHVPIAGGPKLATALLGGHIKAWAGAGTHVQFVKDGTMRLLLSFNIVRMKAAPDIPTIFEVYLKEYRLGTPLLIIGPKGLPEPVAKKLESAYTEAMKTPAYQKFLDHIQFPAICHGAQETVQDMERQSKGWAELLKITGIKDQE